MRLVRYIFTMRKEISQHQIVTARHTETFDFLRASCRETCSRWIFCMRYI